MHPPDLAKPPSTISGFLARICLDFTAAVALESTVQSGGSCHAPLIVDSDGVTISPALLALGGPSADRPSDSPEQHRSARFRFAAAR